MDLRLSGKRALITGGSKGIGFAAAESLATEGVDVILVARDQAVLDTAAAKLRGRHQVQVSAVAADLSDEAEVLRVAKHASDIDILVNNAGAIPPGTLRVVDEGTWRRAWDLKVFGFISLCRAAYPALADRAVATGGPSVIVNIIGSAGEKLDPGYICGSTGNAALMAFTRTLGKTSTADGIRVVGINPGPIATERMEMLLRRRALNEFGDEARWAELCAKMAFGRAGQPEEIGDAVAFLASARAGYVSGTVLTIDGGG